MDQNFGMYDNHYIRRFEQIIQTNNDNSNSSINSTATTSEGKKRRTPLTQEQREMINSKRRVAALTVEQREKRNQKRRITHLSAEQRERINSKRRVTALSAEQREKRNQKRRVSSLTAEQREKRNQKRRISSMSAQQRAVLNSKRRRNTSANSHTSHGSHQTSSQGTTLVLTNPGNAITNGNSASPGNTNNAQGSPTIHHITITATSDGQLQLQPSTAAAIHHQAQASTNGGQHLQQSQQQQQVQVVPQFINVQLEPGKKLQDVFPPGTVVTDVHGNQLTSYENLQLLSRKMVQYTPQEMDLINSIRSNAVMNINRRC